jgi:hypothetical protein
MGKLDLSNDIQIDYHFCFQSNPCSGHKVTYKGILKHWPSWKIIQ